MTFSSTWKLRATLIPVVYALTLPSSALRAEEKPRPQQATPAVANADDARQRQAQLEAGLIKMLSGATLDGTFTSTGPGSDPTKLSRDKYTLGDVKKLSGDLWLIPARIQYGTHDVTLPVTVPIRWAGDTPVIVVDTVELPGFGAVSARVMFFDDHYAGYWKHGEHGGHMFGVIARGEKPAAKSERQEKGKSRSATDQPGSEQRKQ